MAMMSRCMHGKDRKEKTRGPPKVAAHLQTHLQVRLKGLQSRGTPVLCGHDSCCVDVQLGQQVPLGGGICVIGGSKMHSLAERSMWFDMLGGDRTACDACTAANFSEVKRGASLPAGSSAFGAHTANYSGG
eukprot:scaffold16227_cov14-Tisochrysis_lutea.AAC.2